MRYYIDIILYIIYQIIVILSTCTVSLATRAHRESGSCNELNEKLKSRVCICVGGVFVIVVAILLSSCFVFNLSLTSLSRQIAESLALSAPFTLSRVGSLQSTQQAHSSKTLDPCWLVILYAVLRASISLSSGSDCLLQSFD